MFAFRLAFFSLLLSSSFVFGASGITYHGRIVKPDNQPLESPTTRFRIQIKAPDAGNCVLWEEEQTRNMSNSGGAFSITIGDSTDTTISYSRIDTYGWSMERVFSNRSQFSSLTGCAVGNDYIPNAADGRILEVSFKEAASDPTWEAFPATKVNLIPMSLNSLQLEGYRANEFLKIDPFVNQTPINNAGVNTLLGLIAGTSNLYVKPADPLGGDLTGTIGAGTVVGLRGRALGAAVPAVGQVLKFDGTSWVPSADDTGGAPADASYAAKGVVQFDTSAAVSGVTVTAGVARLADTIAAGGPVGASATIPVITYDAKGRLTTVTTATVDDATKLRLAGGTMTGPINMGLQNITNATSVAATNFSGRNLLLSDNDTNVATIRAPVNLAADYALTLPTAAPTNGYVLSTDGTGQLSWIAAATGAVVSVDATLPVLSSGGTTPVISLDTGLGINKVPQVGGTALGANGVVVANGTATALTSLNCAVNQVIKFDASGFAVCGADDSGAANAFVQNGNAFGAAAVLGTNDAQSLTLETNNTPRMIMTSTGTTGFLSANQAINTGSSNLAIFSSDTQAADTGGSLGFGGQDGVISDRTFARISGRKVNGTSGNYSGYLSFETWENGNLPQERLRINELGNVGIGTTNPGNKLTVEDNANNNSSTGIGIRNTNAGASAGTGISIGNDASADIAWIYTGSSTYSNTLARSRAVLAGAPSAEGVSIWAESGTGDIRMITGGTSTTNERMRIDSSGNVGIGTTTPATKLDVSGAVRIGNDATACAAGLAGSLRYNGGAVQFCNGSTWQSFGVSGAGLTSLNGQTGNTQTFNVTATGLAPAINSATDVHTLSIPLASGAGVTSGTISKVDYDNFSGKLTSPLTTKGDLLVQNATAPARLPVGTNGQILAANSATATGLEWVPAPTSDVTSVVGGDGLINDGLTGVVTLNVGDGNGILVAADTVAVDTGLGINKIPQVGGTALGANGVVVANGTATALTSLNCAVNQVIKFDASGFATCGTDDSGVVNAFAQNGNAFGATAVLGTNDNFGLNFETNSVARMRIKNDGTFDIGTNEFPAVLGQFVFGSNPFDFTAGTLHNIANVTHYNGTNSGNGLLEGVYNIVDSASTGNQTGTFVGTRNRIAHYGNGGSTLTNAKAHVSEIAVSGGNLINGYGFESNVNLSGSGSLTNFYGMMIRNPSDTSSGSVTNNYGLYIENQFSATGQNYSIFSDGGTNYFAGPVGIGSGVTGPSSALEVNGATTMRGIGAPAVSSADQGRIYFDPTLDKFRVSEGGGAYVDLVSSGGAATIDQLTDAITNYAVSNNMYLGLGVGVTTTTGARNTAMGAEAMQSVTTGYDNSAIGSQALQNLTTGNFNTAIGRESMLNTSTGSNNTAVGMYSAANITTGGGNTAFGDAALSTLMTGTSNTAIGSGAIGNLNGESNTALGWRAGYKTIGNSDRNIFLGYFAGPDTNQTISDTLWIANYEGNPTIYGDLANRRMSIGGTTNPSTTLDINGATTVREMAAPALSPADQGRIYFDSTSNKFRVSENGGAYVDLVGGGSSSGTAGHLQFSNGSGGFSSDNNQLFWNSTNNRLGIGTNAPTTDLTIAGAGGGDMNIVSGGGGIYTPLTFTSGDVGGPNAYFMHGAGSGTVFLSTSINGNGSGYPNDVTLPEWGTSLDSTTDSFTLYRGPAGAGPVTYSEMFKVTGAGNVGIGTTAPSTRLDISGAFSVREMAAPALSPTDQGRIYFDSTSNKFRVSENGGAYVDLVTSGGLTGTAATNTIPKFTAASTLGASSLTDDGTTVGSAVNLNLANGRELQLNGSTAIRRVGVVNQNWYLANAGNGTTGGGSNIGIGNGVMWSQTGGDDNTIIGQSAGGGSWFTNASQNTFVGSSSGFNSSTQRTQTTALGYTARVNADQATAIGSNTLVSGANSTAIGYQAQATAANSVVLGNSSANVGIANVTAPTSRLDLTGAVTIRSIAAPAAPAAGQGRIYFDSTSNKFRVSENGGAYVDLVGGGSGITGLTAGRVPFAASATTITDSANLTFDAAAGLFVNSTNNGSVSINGSAVSEGLNLRNMNTSGYSTVGSGASLEFQIDSDNNSTSQYFSFTNNGSTELMRIAENGNVGIGTTNPTSKLEVAGGVRAVAGAVTSALGTDTDLNIDFSAANVITTSASCNSTTLTNMQDGGSYTLIVTGTSSGTCTFTHAGVSSFKFAPANGATDVAAGGETVYTFLKAGSKVYVSWITGMR